MPMLRSLRKSSPSWGMLSRMEPVTPDRPSIRSLGARVVVRERSWVRDTGEERIWEARLSAWATAWS